jgi:hypothetical protein
VNGQERIDELYAFIVVDDDGTEGVPAFRAENMVMPLMGADMGRMGDYREIAGRIANEYGRKVTLCKFTNRETVEEVEPDAGLGDPPSV